MGVDPDFVADEDIDRKWEQRDDVQWRTLKLTI